jgi:hypothetical protein
MKLILGIFLSFGFLSIDAQNLNGVWVADSNRVCVEFDSTTHRFNLGDEIDDYKRSKKSWADYRIRNESLIIRWYNNQNWLCIWVPEKTEWKLKLNDANLLTLTYIKGSGPATEEILGRTRLVLKLTEHPTCSHYYSRLKGINAP